MKKTYDLRVNTHGNCQPMEDGFFRKNAEAASLPYDEDKYTLVECPKAIYRIDTYSLTHDGYQKTAYEKYIERARKLSANE